MTRLQQHFVNTKKETRLDGSYGLSFRFSAWVKPWCGTHSPRWNWCTPPAASVSVSGQSAAGSCGVIAVRSSLAVELPPQPAVTEPQVEAASPVVTRLALTPVLSGAARPDIRRRGG